MSKGRLGLCLCVLAMDSQSTWQLQSQVEVRRRWQRRQPTVPKSSPDTETEARQTLGKVSVVPSRLRMERLGQPMGYRMSC